MFIVVVGFFVVVVAVLLCFFFFFFVVVVVFWGVSSTEIYQINQLLAFILLVRRRGPFPVPSPYDIQSRSVARSRRRSIVASNYEIMLLRSRSV